MDAEEKVERPAASRYKHRQGYKSVKVAVTVGNGRIRSINYYEGELTKEKYVEFFTMLGSPPWKRWQRRTTAERMRFTSTETTIRNPGKQFPCGDQLRLRRAEGEAAVLHAGQSFW